MVCGGAFAEFCGVCWFVGFVGLVCFLGLWVLVGCVFAVGVFWAACLCVVALEGLVVMDVDLLLGCGLNLVVFALWFCVWGV